MSGRRVIVWLALALGVGGCMPWAVGETAETLRPGGLGLGAGAAGLVPPVEPKEGLAVGQVWAGIGVVEGLEARLDYVLPATVHGGVKLRLLQRPGWAVAATAGLGLHRVPEFGGYEAMSSTPFATAGLVGSRRNDALRTYGAVRAIVPFVLGDNPDAVLWLSAVGGIELGRRRLRYGPEMGVVVPTSHPEDWLLQLAFSLRVR